MNTTTTTDGQPTVTWVLETKFKDLTDEEIDKIENAIYCKTIQKGKTQHEYIKAFARAILRKAQEK